MSEPVNYLVLSQLRLVAQLARSEASSLLVGRTVRYKGWLTGGVQRTGTIVQVIELGSAREGRLGIAVGVAVDRLDGRPGHLVDTWYGDLGAMEIL